MVPEFELFDLGHVATLHRLLDELRPAVRRARALRPGHGRARRHAGRRGHAGRRRSPRCRRARPGRRPGSAGPACRSCSPRWRRAGTCGSAWRTRSRSPAAARSTGNAELVNERRRWPGWPSARPMTPKRGTDACWGCAEPCADSPVLAEVVRSGFLESRHRGVGRRRSRADGSIAAVAPAPSTSRCSRGRRTSRSRPPAMLRCGLDLDGELLALAAASHSGEDFHVAGVRRDPGRRRADRGRAAVPARPAARRGRAAGHDPGRRRARPDPHELLGQARGDAGHLRGGRLADRRPTATRSTRCSWRSGAAYRALAGEPVAAIGVDGCGAPLLAHLADRPGPGVPRRWCCAEPGTPERRVADAMRAYPDWTSGTHRPERALMAAVPGLLLKAGAEGVERVRPGRRPGGGVQDRRRQPRGPGRRSRWRCCASSAPT